MGANATFTLDMVSVAAYERGQKKREGSMTGFSNQKYISLLLEIGTPKYFQAGCHVAKEGETDASLFVLTKGSLQIRKRIRSEDFKSLATVDEANSILGEVAFLTGNPRSADIVAHFDSHVCVVPRIELMRRLESNPMDGLAFYKRMARDLAEKLTKNNAELREAILWALDEMTW